MSRRREIPKRDVHPDPKFGDKLVQKFASIIMFGGKKSTAEKIVYGAFDIIEQKYKQPPIEVFRKALDAASSEGIDEIVIGGGVAANSRLRVLAEERATKLGIRIRVPRPGLCTDNGAMVAALGAEMVARGRPASDFALSADSSLPVTEPHVAAAR